MNLRKIFDSIDSLELVRNSSRVFDIEGGGCYYECDDEDDPNYDEFFCGEVYDIVVDGVVVGHMCVSSGINGNEIKGFVIDKKYKKKGYGVFAVEKAIEMFGIDYVRAIPTAKTFWERMGFKVCSYNKDAELYDMTR